MLKYKVLLLLILALFIGCSNQPTNDGMISLEEIDGGMNLKVTPSTALQSGYVINFTVPTSGEYNLVILNATGYTVRSWNASVSAGNQSITWNLTNDDDRVVKPGIYIFEVAVSEGFARQVEVIRENK